MSTIHSTFNRVNTTYTVIGGDKQIDGDKEIGVLLLNRGGRLYRNEIYKELSNLNVTEVISIEIGTRSHFDLEKESLDYKFLKFLIFKNDVSTGEMINIGMYETKCKNVLVLWDDIEFSSKIISYRVFDKIIEAQNLCTIPQFVNENNEIVPTLMTPFFDRELLKVVPLSENKSSKSLYPFIYVGIYNRDKFIKLGGYDIDIKNEYWQKLDFGLRANLWGELIILHKSLKMKLNTSSFEIEDITPDPGYRLYSLKNLSVIIKKDEGILPYTRFYSYYEKSGSSILEAFKTFRSVKNWVKINRFRFKYTAPQLTKDWDE